MTEPARPARQVSAGSLDGRPALLVGGIVQSVLVAGAGDEPDGYWAWLLPEAPPERVLLLGLGGATVVRLLLHRFPAAGYAVVGIDDDPAMLTAAAEAFGMNLPGLTVVQADARVYLHGAARRPDAFDLIVVDLFRDGAVPTFVHSRGFLRRLARVLDPAGLLTINFNRGSQRTIQLRRLGWHFVPERLIGTGMNLVVHARARGRRTYRRRG